jgi:hypothetical protein
MYEELRSNTPWRPLRGYEPTHCPLVPQWATFSRTGHTQALWNSLALVQKQNAFLKLLRGAFGVEFFEYRFMAFLVIAVRTYKNDCIHLMYPAATSPCS